MLRRSTGIPAIIFLTLTTLILPARAEQINALIAQRARWLQ